LIHFGAPLAASTKIPSQPRGRPSQGRSRAIDGSIWKHKSRITLRRQSTGEKNTPWQAGQKISWTHVARSHLDATVSPSPSQFPLSAAVLPCLFPNARGAGYPCEGRAHHGEVGIGNSPSRIPLPVFATPLFPKEPLNGKVTVLTLQENN
jgi:hypothetical protein